MLGFQSGILWCTWERHAAAAFLISGKRLFALDEEKN